MKTFKVYRIEDVSGVSGTGIIAEGVQFHDGQCVVSWFGQHHTLEISPSVETFMAIHGHSGKTTLQWSNGRSLRGVKDDTNK
jgi:hypothetical protein